MRFNHTKGKQSGSKDMKVVGTKHPEKGVHEQELSHHFYTKGKQGFRDSGVSVAGAKARIGDAPSHRGSKDSGYESSKRIHREKLEESKAIGKPNLPKSEKGVSKLQKFLDIKKKNKPIEKALGLGAQPQQEKQDKAPALKPQKPLKPSSGGAGGPIGY
jgi:hypothetical protein